MVALGSSLVMGIVNPPLLFVVTLEGLSLSYSASELEATESGPESYRISHRDYLYYATVD